jgi:hypothetical protein
LAVYRYMTRKTPLISHSSVPISAVSSRAPCNLSQNLRFRIQELASCDSPRIKVLYIC